MSEKRPIIKDRDAFFAQIAAQHGIHIKDLDAGDMIEVETCNHRYRFELLDPERQRVRATSDGPHITEPIEVCLQGSALAGTSWLRTGWIGIGHQIEVGHLTLSTTKKVSINGVQVLPVSGSIN